MNTGNQGTGDCENIHLNITEPIKFEKMDLEYRKINLLTGMNSTGKSLILKLTWAVSLHVNNYLLAGTKSIPFNELIDAQFILDSTFTNQDFNGQIKVDFKNIACELDIEKGKVISSIMFSKITNLVPSTNPIYMSTNMRLYSQINGYLKIKDLLGIKYLLFDSIKLPSLATVPVDLDNLLKHYRLYDILLVERLLYCLQQGMFPRVKLNEQLKNFDFKDEILDVRLKPHDNYIEYQTHKGWANTETLGA